MSEQPSVPPSTVSSDIPCSMLRQHAARFSKGTVSLQAYREKRSEILDDLVTTHIPLPPPPSPPVTHTKSEHSNLEKARTLLRNRQPSFPNDIALLSIMLFTVAVVMLLPNAHTSLRTLSSNFSASAAAAAELVSNDESVLAANLFQLQAMQMSKKESWAVEDIDQMLLQWSQLNAEQQYSARRYNGYHRLISSAASRAADLRELIEVSTLSNSLEQKAQQFDRVTHTLMYQ